MSSGRGLAPEDIFAIRLVEDPRISPDGRRVAHVLMQMDRETYEYRRVLWLVDTETAAALPLSEGPLDTAPRWSPDGSRIAFLRAPRSSVKPASAAEAERGVGKPQLWVMDVATHAARPLTQLRGGAADPVWAPDGRSLVVCSAVGDADDAEAEAASFAGANLPAVRVIDRLWYRSDGVGYTYERRSQLFRVDCESGACTQLTDGDWDSRLAAFSPDGSVLAFVSDRSPDRFRWPGGAIWLLRLDAAQPGAATLAQPCRLTPESISCGRPVWSPDGERIAYRGNEVLTVDGYVELFVVDAQGGAPRWISEHFEPTCSNICLDDQRVPPGTDDPMWSADGSEVRLLCSGRGSVHLWGVRVDGGGWEQLTHGECHVYAVSADHSGQRLALGASSPRVPGDVVMRDLDSGREWRLTDVNASLFAERELAGAEEVWLRASDGAELQGWILSPPWLPPEEPAPAVLQIHGGPQAMYGWTFCMEFQVLAAAGMRVVYGNPRGSVGYGARFAREIALHWGERDRQDLLDLLDRAVAAGGIDQARVGVAGGSYGGYMTLWLLGHDDDARFRAGVAMRPLTNWASFFGTSDIGPRFTLLEAGATPWHDLGLLMRHSPVSVVERISAPLLLMHSDADLRCPVSESEQIYAALRFLGRPVRFVRFEGQSHDLSRSGHPRSRLIRLQHVTEWLRAHVVGEEAGATPAEFRREGSVA